MTFINSMYKRLPNYLFEVYGPTLRNQIARDIVVLALNHDINMSSYDIRFVEATHTLYISVQTKTGETFKFRLGCSE